MDSIIIKGDTQVCAVFGDPISHSLSPVMHNAAFRALGLNYIYIPCHVRAEQIGDAIRGIRAFNLKGVNLTIPHKQAVLSELDEIFGDSLLSGSVNTIINRNGKLYGTSTDGIGLLKSLKEDGGFEVNGKNVLLLGAGGSAAAVIYRLIDAGVNQITVLNRTKSNADNLCRKVKNDTGFRLRVGDFNQLERWDWNSFDLLINTTSVGLHDQNTLIPPQFLKPSLFVYDLVYRQGGTALINQATQAGCRTLSGLSLLLYQGAESFRLWFEIEPPLKVMREALTAFK